jgi:hypothetical protein
MARDEEAEVAGQYKVHVSGTIYELTGEKFYDLFREFLFIVILMYPMPSLTLMLDILGNFLVGVLQFGIRAGRFRSCLGSLEFNKNKMQWGPLGSRRLFQMSCLAEPDQLKLVYDS